MLNKLKPLLILTTASCAVASLSCAAAEGGSLKPPPSEGEPGPSCTVDWRRPVGHANRPLFSIQGFPQIWVQPNPLILDTFLLLNPEGTHQRLEILINLMEPENDDDDANHFDWGRFDPKRMIRFIDDSETFLKELRRYGMEPLLLLCYNAAWLKSDDPDDPVADHEEWAEFAAAVVETFNGSGEDYRPNARLVQLWNEPNAEMFWSGSPEAFYRLFRTAAERLHRDYPGLMIGGPTVTGNAADPDGFIRGFLDYAGDQVDWIIFHHYGAPDEGLEPLTGKAREYRDWLRALPGKENAPVAMTETDNWFTGWPKARFVLERQFGFIDMAADMLSLHHFCALAYNEAGYVFGVIDFQAAPIIGNYWPYWLFRNWIGETVHARREGARREDYRLTATRHENEEGARLASAVWFNQSDAPIELETHLYFDPAASDRTLATSVVGESSAGLREVRRIAAGEDHCTLPLRLEPGQGLSLTLLEPGKRHFAFRDLNNQETPWLEMQLSEDAIDAGGEVDIEVRVLNTLHRPLSGKLWIGGFPDESWRTEVVRGDAAVRDLAFGEEIRTVFRLHAPQRIEPGRLGLSAWLMTPGEKGSLAEPDPGDLTLEAPHSIPRGIEVRSPLNANLVQAPLRVVPGQEAVVEVQMRNRINRKVAGEIRLEIPDGSSLETPSPHSFEIPAGRTNRESVALRIPPDAAEGALDAQVLIESPSLRRRLPLSIEIHHQPLLEKAVTIDIGDFLNIDPVSFAQEPDAYDSDAVGPFAFSGDYLPCASTVFSAGVPFQMPRFRDQGPSALAPTAPVEIPVAAGRYARLHMLAAAHDGAETMTLNLHYDDGKSAGIQIEVPDWCELPDAGAAARVAFEAPRRHSAHGPVPPACRVFAISADLDAQERLESITLAESPECYVFALTLEPSAE